jgi:TPR repeat protein
MRNKSLAEDIKILRQCGKIDKTEDLFSRAIFFLNDHEPGEEYDHIFDWMEAAAEEGHIEAMSYLSSFYLEGKGIEKDDEKAFEWSKRAAENGNTYDQIQLGNFYENGIGTTVNFEEARKWYEKAMGKGNPEPFMRLVSLSHKERGIMRQHVFADEELRSMTSSENRALWLRIGQEMDDEKDGICHYGLNDSELSTYRFYFDYECVNDTELEVVAVICGDIYGLPSDRYINRHNRNHKSGAVHYIENPPVGKEGFEVNFSDFPNNYHIIFAVNVINTNEGEHDLRDVRIMTFFSFCADTGSPDHIRATGSLPYDDAKGKKGFDFISVGFSSHNRVDVTAMFLYSKTPYAPEDTGKVPLPKPEKPQRVFGKIQLENGYINPNDVCAYSIPLDKDGLVPAEFYDSNAIYKEGAWFLYLKGYNNRINTIDFHKLPPQVETVILTATALNGDLSGVKYSLIDEFNYSKIYTFNVGESFPKTKTVIIGKLIREAEGFQFEAYTEAYDEGFIDVFKRFAPERRICRT